jgi:hypothetical protein
MSKIESLNEMCNDDLKELLYSYQESPSRGKRDEIIMEVIANILEERSKRLEERFMAIYSLQNKGSAVY